MDSAYIKINSYINRNSKYILDGEKISYDNLHDISCLLNIEKMTPLSLFLNNTDLKQVFDELNTCIENKTTIFPEKINKNNLLYYILSMYKIDSSYLFSLGFRCINRKEVEGNIYEYKIYNPFSKETRVYFSNIISKTLFDSNLSQIE